MTFFQRGVQGGGFGPRAQGGYQGGGFGPRAQGGVSGGWIFGPKN